MDNNRKVKIWALACTAMFAAFVAVTVVAAEVPEGLAPGYAFSTYDEDLPGFNAAIAGLMSSELNFDELSNKARVTDIYADAGVVFSSRVVCCEFSGVSRYYPTARYGNGSLSQSNPVSYPIGVGVPWDIETHSELRVEFSSGTSFAGAYFIDNAAPITVRIYDINNQEIGVFSVSETRESGNSGEWWGIVTDERIIARMTFTAESKGDFFAIDNFTFQSNMTACIPPPSGLISWWPGDGDANDIVADNNGMIAGSAAFAYGKVEQGFNFDGNGRVEIPDSAALNITGPLAIDAWVKFNGISYGSKGNSPIVAKWGDTNYGTAGYGLFVYSDGRPAFALSSNGRDRFIAAAPIALPEGAFAHIAGVWTGYELELYVNGELEATENFNGSINTNDVPLLIGGYSTAYTSGPDSLIGMVDEVELHNRALSENEIIAIYMAGSAGKCRPHNNLPVADAGPDQTIECSGPDGTPVTLDGSGSSDPDGDELTYTWTWDGGSAEDVNPTVTLPYDTTTVTLTVSDGEYEDNDDVDITITDTTPPSTSAVLEGELGDNGWYVSDVTVTLTSTDSCTGVKEIHYTINGTETVVSGDTASFTLSQDGVYTVTYWAVDNAGREGTHGTTPVNREVTPPVTTPDPSGTGGDNGNYTSCVVVDLDAVAGSSGVAYIVYSVNGGAPQVYEGSFTLCNDGDNSVSYSAVSNAGNKEEPKSIVIKIDQTPPNITATVDPPANASGWHNTNVTVSFVCADATSGIAECPQPIIVTTEGTGQVITGTAKDRAGNTASTSVTLNIDKTAPTADLSVTPGVLWPPNHKMVNLAVNGGANDPASDIASIEFTVTDEYGTVEPSVSGFNTTIPLEAWRNGGDRDGRHYTITAVITDKAGNVTTVTTEAVCPHDMREKK